MPRDIIVLHLSTKNLNMIYDSGSTEKTGYPNNALPNRDTYLGTQKKIYQDY